MAKVCALFLLFVLVGTASVQAGSRFVQEPQLQACGLWNETTHALMEGSLASKDARERYQSLWKTIVVDEVPSPKEKHWQWMFPLAGHRSDSYGESYQPDNYRFLDGPKAQGYPALRLFLRDADRDGLDDRTRKPAPVVSATDGVVVAAEKYWKEGDANPWGQYVWVLAQQDKLFFLYANLGKLRVGPGQLVVKGEVLGWLGRTGKGIEAKHLGTQLRFQVNSFNEGLFFPVYPGRALRVAGQVAWPIPVGEVRPKIKVPAQVKEESANETD